MIDYVLSLEFVQYEIVVVVENFHLI